MIVRIFVILLTIAYNASASTSYYYLRQTNIEINKTASQCCLSQLSIEDSLMSCLVTCNMNSACLNAVYRYSDKNCWTYSTNFDSADYINSTSNDLFTKRGKFIVLTNLNVIRFAKAKP